MFLYLLSLLHCDAHKVFDELPKRQFCNLIAFYFVQSLPPVEGGEVAKEDPVNRV